MRVIITGSRDWEGIYATQRVHTILNLVYGLAWGLQQKLTIVHGDCPTGADRIADAWARRRELEVVTFPADWATHGKAAGPIRNAAMIQAGGDMCLAFLRNNSVGTRTTIAMSQAANIPTYTILWEEPS